MMITVETYRRFAIGGAGTVVANGLHASANAAL
jgi:hypothetical protein